MRKLGTLPSGWLGSIVSSDEADARPFLVEGVRVKFELAGRKAVRAARAACSTVLRDTGDMLAASDALTIELVRHGIIEWEGIGDAEGNVAAVDPDSIALFLADTDLVEAAEAVYVRPWLVRDAEKNGSAGSSDGTSVAGTPASDTAITSANGEKTDDVRPSPTVKPKKPAKAAATSPSSRASKRVKASTKS